MSLRHQNGHGGGVFGAVLRCGRYVRKRPLNSPPPSASTFLDAAAVSRGIPGRYPPGNFPGTLLSSRGITREAPRMLIQDPGKPRGAPGKYPGGSTGCTYPGKPPTGPPCRDVPGNAYLQTRAIFRETHSAGHLQAAGFQPSYRAQTRPIARCR